jgi:hypothetical protein
MRIGLDFDNTLAVYDKLFVEAAMEKGFIPYNSAITTSGGGKDIVRGMVRSLPDGEDKWQTLQAEVYGPRMPEAVLMDGVTLFLNEAVKQKAELFIVSHKTQFAVFDHDKKYDLRKTALAWMTEKKFFAKDGFAIRRENVFFTHTRHEKVNQIAQLNCDYFIDDLPEVFADPGFLAKIVQILIDPLGNADTNGPFQPFCGWAAIKQEVFGGPIAKSNSVSVKTDCEVLRIAEKLTGNKVTALETPIKGGNNRLFKVVTDKENFALKFYLHLPEDPRDRQGTETQALTFLNSQSVTQVPLLYTTDLENRCSIMEWIDGNAITTPTTPDIDAVLALLKQLHKLGEKPEAKNLPLASAACLSAAALESQISERMLRLAINQDKHPDLELFIIDDFTPFLNKTIASIKSSFQEKNLDFHGETPIKHRVLSPSDLSFPNTLRRMNGDVVFLDFEYFGWDDPVKLASDFLLHPGMQIADKDKDKFTHEITEMFCADASFTFRLQQLFPLFGLCWCLIILNVFLPEGWRRRTFAANPEEKQIALDRQLDKARNLLLSLQKNGRVIKHA